MTDRNTHGGAREGAGRPAGSVRPHRTELVAVRLTPEERRIAEEIGGGVASEGIRVALKRAENKS